MFRCKLVNLDGKVIYKFLSTEEFISIIYNRISRPGGYLSIEAMEPEKEK